MSASTASPQFRIFVPAELRPPADGFDLGTFLLGTLFGIVLSSAACCLLLNRFIP